MVLTLLGLGSGKNGLRSHCTGGPIQRHQLHHQDQAKIHHESLAMYVFQRPGEMSHQQQIQQAQSQARSSASDRLEIHAYRLLRRLFFISLSKGCSLVPPMRRAKQVATTSITIRCIKREVMGLYLS